MLDNRARSLQIKSAPLNAGTKHPGLVTRNEYKADRPAPIVALTAEGELVYRTVLEKRSAFHESLLADLSAEERRRLIIC